MSPRPRLDAPWPTSNVTAKSAAYAEHHHILLVLGAPSTHAVAPILRSPTFARSLLLLVTQDPPPLSTFAHARPTIKILRLDAPLVPAAPAFALSLAQVLDAAAAVAHGWSGTSNTIEQLAQDETGAFTVREPLTPDSLPRPAPTHCKSRLSVSTPDMTFIAPSPRKRPSVASLSFSKSHKRASTLGTPFSSSCRPFDAVISFFPPQQPERSVLRQVVLTSALATPFLAGGMRPSVHEGDLRSPELLWSPPSPNYSRPSSVAISRTGSFVAGATLELATSEPSLPPMRKRRSRFSLFGGSDYGSAAASCRVSSVSVFSSEPVPFTPAYIVHVLPASYRSPKLEGALGAFAAGAADAQRKMPRGYVLAERAVKDLECVLVGALDLTDGDRVEDDDGEIREESRGDTERVRRSAWVAGVLNVVMPPVPPLPRMATTASGQVLFGLPTPPGSEGDGDEEVSGGLPSPPSSPGLGKRRHGEVQPRRRGHWWAIWR